MDDCGDKTKMSFSRGIVEEFNAEHLHQVLHYPKVSWNSLFSMCGRLIFNRTVSVIHMRNNSVSAVSQSVNQVSFRHSAHVKDKKHTIEQRKNKEKIQKQ